MLEAAQNTNVYWIWMYGVNTLLLRGWTACIPRFTMNFKQSNFNEHSLLQLKAFISMVAWELVGLKWDHGNKVFVCNLKR